jgi:hypothetical protein
MKIKAHLLDSESPLVSGQTYISKCGAEIRNAVMVFMWDAQELGRLQVSASRLCQFCWFAKYKLRYLSGMVPGEVAKQMENREQVEE